MSFVSGQFNRELSNILYDNVETQTQELSQTNFNLIASLGYVQDYFNSFIGNYLPVVNPIFSGSLTASGLGGIINVNSGLFTSMITTTGSITTATINTISNATTFLQNPLISINNFTYPINTRMVGEIKMMIPTTIPLNYLLCDGSAYATTLYPLLFQVIGYSYGGSGSTFNVPSFASRFPIGNNGSIAGVASSNYATGNGYGALTNTQLKTYNYDNLSDNTTPLLTTVPPHFHYTYFATSQPSTITPLGVQQYIYNVDVNAQETSSQGNNIQAVDPISGANGINITPSYIACVYWIAYQ
jgi:microcystin-dependent protein